VKFCLRKPGRVLLEGCCSWGVAAVELFFKVRLILLRHFIGEKTAKQVHL
jgi:hypothetical protein